MAFDSYTSFPDVKERLDQIVAAVQDDDLPLDKALELYEEAVGLGLRASDLLEQEISQGEADEAALAIDDGDEASQAVPEGEVLGHEPGEAEHDSPTVA